MNRDTCGLMLFGKHYSASLNYMRQAKMSSINQSDLSELGVQVQNMNTIYEKANRTLIWLGIDTNGLGRVAIDAINKFWLHRASELQISHKQLSKVEDLRRLIPHTGNTPTPQTHQWPALRWFFSRPWFSRLWVIRELNASREAVSFCGHSSVNSHLVALAAQWLVRLDRQHYQSQVPNLGQFIHQAGGMRTGQFTQPSSILAPLNSSTWYKASDQRDRVYSMLSLQWFAEKWLPLKADYTISNIQLLKSVVEVSVRTGDQLMALSYVVHPRGSIRRPSWLPRWDYHPSHLTIWSCADKKQLWDACKRERNSRLTITNDNCLSVFGVQVDVITSTSRFLFKDLGLTSTSGQTLPSQLHGEEWQRIISEGHSQESERKLILDYGEALLCGVSRTVPSRRSTPEEIMDDFLAFLVLLCGEWAPLSSGLKHLGQEILSNTSPLELFRLKARIERHNITRRLFSTSSGFIGNGPEVLQVGDRVCILFGGDVPYILRPERDHFLLVGESYVSGIMGGEFITKWENGEFSDTSEREFRLY
jgi:hypothetical protein